MRLARGMEKGMLSFRHVLPNLRQLWSLAAWSLRPLQIIAVSYF